MATPSPSARSVRMDDLPLERKPSPNRPTRGTQTTERPLRSTTAVAAATFAGVVAKGAGFMPPRHPTVHEACPGEQQVHSASVQGVRQAAGKDIQSGLCGAVDVIGPPPTNGGNRRPHTRVSLAARPDALARNRLTTTSA